MKKLLLLLTFAPALAFSATPGYVYSSKEREIEEQKSRELLESKVGKEYWRNNSKICKTYIPICKTPKIPQYCSDEHKYDQPIKFLIKEFIKSGDSSIYNLYKIQLENGEFGYIMTRLHEAPDREYSENEKSNDIGSYCTYKSNPEELKNAAIQREEIKREAEKKEEEKRLKQLEALAKKPGARIGMTAKTVLEKTNWGRPISVNRTTTARGTNEQWVYDGGYLYFLNGRLYAIQN